MGKRYGHHLGQLFAVFEPLGVGLGRVLAARVGARRLVVEKIQRLGRGLEEKRVVAHQPEHPPRAVDAVLSHHGPEAHLRHQRQRVAQEVYGLFGGGHEKTIPTQNLLIEYIQKGGDMQTQLLQV